MRLRAKKTVLVVAALGLAVAGGAQFRQILKAVGVGAAVHQFGPQINREFNKLTGHKDTNSNFTKTVPIITVGVGAKSAIGAAQVKGAKVNVEKVKAVAAPEVELFGREIRIRAMIPVAVTSLSSAKDIKGVDGVGVSGIVDLKL